MDWLRQKDDITWKKADRGYVHGFDTYVEMHIIGLAQEYFRDNTEQVVGH
jgi:hypothetical protein